MKMIKLIILLFIPFMVSAEEINSAISVRSSKMENKKFDFYVSCRYISKPFSIDLAYERENNDYYMSDHVQWNINKYSRISHLGDEVRNIDIESLLLHIPFSIFNIGIDQTWSNFEDYKVLVNLRMKYKFFEVNYSSNFDDREIIVSKMKFMKELTDNVNLLLLFEYKKFNDDNVWRMNIGINYMFGE